MRAKLPASGDPEAARERLKLTVDIKRLSSMRWPDLKNMVRAFQHDIAEKAAK
jgi:hypothetical protein